MLGGVLAGSLRGSVNTAFSPQDWGQLVRVVEGLRHGLEMLGGPSRTVCLLWALSGFLG